MKKLYTLSALVIFTIFISCEAEPVTGSEDVFLLNSIQISVDTTYTFGNDFRAEGKATNTGNETISPIWFVEGAFFTNAQSSVKMGGANDVFNFSLGPGQTAEWILSFKDSQYPASSYPNFTVGDLRAYKNQSDSGN